MGTKDGAVGLLTSSDFFRICIAEHLLPTILQRIDPSFSILVFNNLAVIYVSSNLGAVSALAIRMTKPSNDVRGNLS